MPFSDNVPCAPWVQRHTLSELDKTFIQCEDKHVILAMCFVVVEFIDDFVAQFMP